MNRQNAVEFVMQHFDDDDLEQDDINAAFTAFFERDPDDEDREAGLWSLMLSAVMDPSCCEECGHPIDGSSGGAGDCNACDARSR
ncbi:MAG: hypothetical protein WCH39_05880 [Schlesneria sp.]